MDTKDGKIHEIDGELFEQIKTHLSFQEKLENGLHSLTGINESELNEKQREKKQVSLHDHKSVMGKKLTTERNKPCPCGSGIKFKKCCLFKK